MARGGTDYYAVLGVAPGASGAAIRAAFRRLAKELHPDVSQAAETADRFRVVVEAYDVLSDPARRVAYDAAYWKGGLDARVVAPGVVPAPMGRTARRPAEARPAEVRPAVRAAPGSAAPSGVGGGGGGPVRREARPARREAGPVTPVQAIGGVGSISAGERMRRAAEIGRAAAVRTRCVECGALVVAGADRCAACLSKYGSFRDHLARAAARLRR